MKAFLEPSFYIDFDTQIIKEKARALFAGCSNDVQRAEAAYEFVRDKIPHSFDCGAQTITAKASDVLQYKTGICHAKANLLAALLRSQGIPAGLRFQHITLSGDDSAGYCVHAFNAVFLNGKWAELDARGNKPGIHARFSLDSPVLAYQNRKEYDEYFWDGIYSAPHKASMSMLEAARSLEDIVNNIPDKVEDIPDIPGWEASGYCVHTAQAPSQKG